MRSDHVLQILRPMAALGEILAGARTSGLSSITCSFGTVTGSALADALFGDISARRQWKYQKKQMALQQRYALEQMAQQMQYQKEFFNMQNQYNDPSAVFARFRKAGVTPAGALGSSGAQIGATVSGGGSTGASGPGSSGAIGAGKVYSGDPIAISQTMLNDSAADRNRAAADRDRAEARSIQNQTQSAEHYASIASLNKSILKAQVKDLQAVGDMHLALATLYQADAEFADLAATYKFQDLIAQYSKHVEEYENLRKYNVEYMDRLYSAQITLDIARAYQAQQSGSLAASEASINKVRLADIQNWFNLNWETAVPVPEVDEKGKPTGKNRMMTGKEIQEYLLAMSTAQASQGVSANWFNIRSEKNAFGYSIVNAVVHGALGMAGSALGARMFGRALSTSSQSTGSESSTTSIDRYDKHGQYIGGTQVRREAASSGASLSRRR